MDNWFGLLQISADRRPSKGWIVFDAPMAAYKLVVTDAVKSAREIRPRRYSGAIGVARIHAQILDGKWVRDQILSGWKDRAPPWQAEKGGPQSQWCWSDPIRLPRFTSGTKSRHASRWACTARSTRRRSPSRLTNCWNWCESRTGAKKSMAFWCKCRFRSMSDSRRILVALRPDKDVDGFHPVNVGNLVANIPGPRHAPHRGLSSFEAIQDTDLRS